jgi:phage shock protein A
MGDVGMAIQRAEDKTQELQARGSAIDELMASGALDDPTGTSKDDITAELERLSSGTEVDSQLEAMKLELAGGSSKQLESGSTKADGDTQDTEIAEGESA